MPFVTRWKRRISGGKATANNATQKFAHGGGVEGRINVPCKTY